MFIHYTALYLYNINHLYLEKKKNKKITKFIKIVEEKNLKKTIKSCNIVQYVCLFTTMQVENKDVCKIVKNCLLTFNRQQIELYHLTYLSP